MHLGFCLSFVLLCLLVPGTILLAEDNTQLTQLEQRVQALEVLLGVPVAAVNADEPVQASGTASPRDLYRKALTAWRARDQQISERLFTRLIQEWPRHRHAGNAYFWLADMARQQQNWELAGKYLEAMVELFPEHYRVPDALYYLADGRLRQGDTDVGVALLNRLLESYPDSTGAVRANRALRDIQTQRVQAQ